MDIVRDGAAFQRYFKGDKLFRRTLWTKQPGDVFEAAAEKQREYDDLVAQARASRDALAAAAPIRALRKVTKELLADIKAHQHAVTARPFAQASVWAEQDEELAEHFQRMIDDRELFAEDRRDLLTRKGARAIDRRDAAPLDTAAELIERLGLDAPAGSPERSLVSVAVREGALAGERDIDRIIAGEVLHMQPPPRLEEPSTPSCGPTLREVVELYVSDVAMTPKTRREVLVSLGLFETIVGNKALVELQRRHFTSYIEQLAKKQVGGRSSGSVARPIARDTVKKRYGFLRAAINHAIEKNLHDGGNPATGIDIGAWVKAPDKAVTPDKRPFRLNELNLIFRHPWFTGCRSRTQLHRPGDIRLSGEHYWAPVVALFTGCRASELGGLKLNEVHLDDGIPHIHVRDNEYRPTKGGYARFVPLLDALLDMGFADYVASVQRQGADRLFPDWESPKRSGVFDKDDAAWSNASMIRSFNRTVIDHRLGNLLSAGARREVTFHSFRGAFKSMLGLKKHGVPPNVINEVIGHAKSELDQRYVGVIALEETYPAIRACNWDALKIPPAPPLPYGTDPVGDLELIVARCLQQVVFPGVMSERPHTHADLILRETGRVV
jgi:integrase